MRLLSSRQLDALSIDTLAEEAGGDELLRLLTAALPGVLRATAG